MNMMIIPEWNSTTKDCWSISDALDHFRTKTLGMRTSDYNYMLTNNQYEAQNNIPYHTGFLSIKP
jgi:hypothetical protein